MNTKETTIQLNYDQLTAFLRSLPIDMTTSECHGVLTGLIAAGKTINQENWLAHVLEEQNHIEQLAADDKALFAEWHNATSTSLAADDFSFAPCLPDDEEPLDERLRALVDWCHGFLYGLAATGDVDFETLPAEAAETLSDLGEIGQLDVITAMDDDDAEADLLEIVEYVRMASLSLYDDIRAQQKLQATTDFLNKTVH